MVSRISSWRIVMRSELVCKVDSLNLRYGLHTHVPDILARRIDIPKSRRGGVARKPGARELKHIEDRKK